MTVYRVESYMVRAVDPRVLKEGTLGRQRADAISSRGLIDTDARRRRTLPLRGAAISFAVTVILVACGGPGVSLGPSSPPASPLASQTTFASASILLVATDPDCDGGQTVSGDIDRPAGAPIDPIQSLLKDFEGVLTTDQLVLGSYQGRPAVIVTRDQRVVFIGSFGQDGRIYQYVGCAAAGIQVGGT